MGPGPSACRSHTLLQKVCTAAQPASSREAGHRQGYVAVEQRITQWLACAPSPCATRAATPCMRFVKHLPCVADVLLCAGRRGPDVCRGTHAPAGRGAERTATRLPAPGGAAAAPLAPVCLARRRGRRRSCEASALGTAGPGLVASCSGNLPDTAP